MDPIIFTVDEATLAAAICSLQRTIKSRNVSTIKCSLTKTRIKLDAGEWGCAFIKAKGEKTCTFQITNKALTHAAARYRKLKGASNETPAEIDEESQTFRTPNMEITLI